jgi:DNA-binding GntR family transcriptional regulator
MTPAPAQVATLPAAGAVAPPRRHKGEALPFVLRQLREAILEGRLEPGARIYQEVVAAEYGTSRLPVRQALGQLENEGLVTRRPGAGVRVARLDLGELEEVYWLREQLEPGAVSRSASRLSTDQLQALRELVEAMETIDETAEPMRWLAIDTEFHLLILGATGLPRLERILGSLWNLAAPYRRAYAARIDAGAFRIAEAEHRLLLDALERRNGPDAAEIHELHVRRTRLGLAAAQATAG